MFQKLRTITPIIHNFEGLNSFDSLSLGQIAPKFQGFLMVCVLEQKPSGQVLWMSLLIKLVLPNSNY